MKRQWRRLVSCISLLAFLVTSAPPGLMAGLRSQSAAAAGCSTGCDCRTSPTRLDKKSNCSCCARTVELPEPTVAIELDKSSQPSKNSSCPCCPNCPGCIWCSIAKAPCVPTVVAGLQVHADLAEFVMAPSLHFPPAPCREIIQPPNI
jgi:hypothetical protein